MEHEVCVMERRVANAYPGSINVAGGGASFDFSADRR